MEVDTGTNVRGRVDEVRTRAVDQARRVTGATDKGIELMPSQIYVIGAICSVCLSAALFLSGRRNWGLFVGQWPPTMLAMGIYTRQSKRDHGRPE